MTQINQIIFLILKLVIHSCRESRLNIFLNGHLIETEWELIIYIMGVEKQEQLGTIKFFWDLAVQC